LELEISSSNLINHLIICREISFKDVNFEFILVNICFEISVVIVFRSITGDRAAASKIGFKEAFQVLDCFSL
jgi:hypothetical protein